MKEEAETLFAGHFQPALCNRHSKTVFNENRVFQSSPTCRSCSVVLWASSVWRGRTTEKWLRRPGGHPHMDTATVTPSVTQGSSDGRLGSRVWTHFVLAMHSERKTVVVTWCRIVSLYPLVSRNPRGPRVPTNFSLNRSTHDTGRSMLMSESRDVFVAEVTNCKLSYDVTTKMLVKVKRMTRPLPQSPVSMTAALTLREHQAGTSNHAGSTSQSCLGQTRSPPGWILVK